MFASSDPIRDNPSYITMNTTMSSCKANGLRGIYNAGATCYQNVILQCFLHNPILRNYYLSDGHPSSSCDVPHCLSCAMDDIFQSFYADESTNGYTAANILSGFWISEKKAFENLVTTKEQDAHEFFQFLAEELHERNGDGKRPEMGSEHTCNCIIHQTYYGKLQTTTTCQNCQGVTSQVQSFLDLSLPLENLAQRKKKGTAKPGPLTLQECLEEEYIKQDKCEYRCNNCGSMQQAKRQTSIRRLPNVLSIQLKVENPPPGPPKPNPASILTEYHTNFPSASSTSKAATSVLPRSTPPCSSPCSSTCCRIPAVPATTTSARTTSCSGRARTTCSASSFTSVRSTRVITYRIAASATSGSCSTITKSSWRRRVTCSILRRTCFFIV